MTKWFSVRCGPWFSYRMRGRRSAGCFWNLICLPWSWALGAWELSSRTLMTDLSSHSDFHQLTQHPWVWPLFIPWTCACSDSISCSCRESFIPMTLLGNGRLAGTSCTWKPRESIPQLVYLVYSTGDSYQLVNASNTLPSFWPAQIDVLSMRGRAFCLLGYST